MTTERQRAPLQKAVVYDQLLVDIILGDPGPGEMLDERALARRYGVGLAGVRDALARLALERLVLRRPRKDTVVAPLDVGEIQECMDVRHLLEAQSARLAAERATPADALAICSAFDGAEAAIAARDFRSLIAMDRAFHRAVLAATRNAVLADKLISLQNIAARYWVFTLGQGTAEVAAADVASHRAVGWAIARRDATRAEALMLEIVRRAPAPATASRRRARRGALRVSDRASS